MTGQILFVQGGGEGVHDQWDDKLVTSLRRELGPGYEILYPRMPEESDPHYAPWKCKLQTELARLDHGAVLVGHSLGAAFLVHALAESAPHREIAGMFLIAAPFIGEGGWPSEEIEPKMVLAEHLPEDVPIFFYHGREDETVPVGHVDLYAKAIPGSVIRLLAKRDHQLNDDLSEVADDIRQLG